MRSVSTAITALGVTLALCPFAVAALGRLGILDRPNDRSSHGAPTPRGGGLPVAAGAVTGLLLASRLIEPWTAGLLVASIGFGVLGLADDVKGLPAMSRLAGQAMVAAASLPFLLHDLGGPLAWKVIFAAGVMAWLVSYVNAFNFMDGINGISAAQAIVAGLAWWAIGLAEDIPALSAAGLMIAVACAGFAPFNVPRARIFLGDVGSYFMGAWLAVLVVIGIRSGLTVEAALAPLALYLADTGVTLVRRVRAGEVWHQAHCGHVYQRLVRGGWSHTATALLVADLVAACSLFGAATVDSSLTARLVNDVALLLVVTGYVYSADLVTAPRRSPVPVA